MERADTEALQDQLIRRVLREENEASLNRDRLIDTLLKGSQLPAESVRSSLCRGGRAGGCCPTRLGIICLGAASTGHAAFGSAARVLLQALLYGLPWSAVMMVCVTCEVEHLLIQTCLTAAAVDAAGFAASADPARVLCALQEISSLFTRHNWAEDDTFEPEPTAVPEPGPTAVPEPEPTAVPEPEPTAVPEPEPTAVPEPEPTAVPEPEPTAVPEPEPTAVPEPEPTAVPEPEPTAVPEPEPTAVPEPEPTAVPEPEPTAVPEPEPTAVPEPEPTAVPEPEPMAVPEPEPTAVPESPPADVTDLTLDDG